MYSIEALRMKDFEILLTEEDAIDVRIIKEGGKIRQNHEKYRKYYEERMKP